MDRYRPGDSQETANNRREDYDVYHPNTREASPQGMRIRGAAHARNNRDRRYIDIDDPRVQYDDHELQNQSRGDEFRGERRHVADPTRYNTNYADALEVSHQGIYDHYHHQGNYHEPYHQRNYDGHYHQRSYDERYYQRNYHKRYHQHEYHDTQSLEPEYQGDNDVGDQPMSFLLVRRLLKRTTERSIADAFDTLSQRHGRPDGPADGSLRRIILICSRETPQDSAGFGFVEYHTVKDSKAAKQEIEKMGEQFQIDAVSPKLDYPHAGVFPHSTIGRPEKTPEYLINMPNSSFSHKYHNMKYFPSVLFVNSTAPKPQVLAGQPTNSQPAKEKGPNEISGIQNVLGIGKSGSKKRKERSLGMELPSAFKSWQKSTAELRGGDAESEDESRLKKPATGVNAISGPTEPALSEQQTFAHVGQDVIACYLCNAQFKKEIGLTYHLLESEKHAKSVDDSEAVEKAHRRLRAKNIDPGSTMKLPAAHEAVRAAGISDSPAFQYRDRAAERRQEEAQAGVAQQSKVSFSLKGASSTAASSAKTFAASSTPSGLYGKGAAMLQKSGYVAGQGLGASGEGTSALIEQSLYARGVGLGHEASKKGDAVEEGQGRSKLDEYAESAKEGARRRFQEMM